MCTIQTRYLEARGTQHSNPSGLCAIVTKTTSTALSNGNQKYDELVHLLQKNEKWTKRSDILRKIRKLTRTASITEQNLDRDATWRGDVVDRDMYESEEAHDN